MALTPKVIAEWFTGTHEQLKALLRKGQPIPNSEPLYEEMKVSELKLLAKQRNLKGYSGLNKSDLIEFLKNSS
jgi:hypothetical protein